MKHCALFANFCFLFDDAVDYLGNNGCLCAGHGVSHEEFLRELLKELYSIRSNISSDGLVT